MHARTHKAICLGRSTPHFSVLHVPHASPRSSLSNAKSARLHWMPCNVRRIADRSHALPLASPHRRTILDTLDSMLYDTTNPMLLLATACTKSRTTLAAPPSPTAATPSTIDWTIAQCFPSPAERKRKRSKPYKCGVCGQPKAGHVCTLSMRQRKRAANFERPSIASSPIGYRVVKLVMRDCPPPPGARWNGECFCAHAGCTTCFPLSVATRAKPCLGEALRALVGQATPSPDGAAHANIRTACADLKRTLASLVMPQGPTGATEAAPESTGPTADERSDDEEFARLASGGRGRYHNTAP